jgi:NAD(P)-dependent dehydrogenase (short-subunit alcohol dehydrogenase family)
MADIFVSYASADRDRAKALAEALATQGWSVWWDRTIPPGRQFDEVIEEELAAAGCVVVLWSKASVASSWVKTEAADARDRRRRISRSGKLDPSRLTSSSAPSRGS